MTEVPTREVKIREKLRLWRTLFIHRWHAPQTIGELHGRPSVGMRFEHINHRESLTQYVWRYGAFRENDAGTGRQDMSDKPSRKNGLQAIIKELENQAPGTLSHAIEYAIFMYGNTGLPDDTDRLPDRLRRHARQLDELAAQHPAIPVFAKKLCRLHRWMLPFYCQMRYLTTEEAAAHAEGKIPMLAPLRPTDSPALELRAGKDPVFFTGDPVAALQEAFSRNIYNALCWRARAELFEVMPPARELQAIASTAIVGDRRQWFRISDEALISTLNSLNETEFPRLLRILATFKTAVSTMITAMPMFIIKNFFRDTLAGFVAGRYWQMPFISTLRGSFFAGRDAVAGHDEAMRDYLLQGGFYSGLVESEVRVDSSVHGLTDGVKFQKTKKWFKYLVHLFTRPAWIVEAGTRIIQYQEARAAGVSKYEAIRAARMVSSDFANIGASRGWRMYVHTVPFMNAAIQGLDQLYQICRPEYRNDLKKPRWGAGRRRHVGKTLRAGTCLAAMAFGVWQWNTGDHDRLDQYLDETDYEKASYLTLYDISGDTDLRIPVPFQIGAAFMKVPEIGFDLSTDTETLAGPRFLWSLIHGNLAISWLPSVVQPFWEVMTNTNFYGAPIIPGYMANWPSTRQFFSRSTPQPMIQLGGLLGVSPLHVQTFVRDWSGHLGTLVITGLDELMWDSDSYGEKPFQRTSGLATGIASIQGYKYKSRTRWSEEFYELANWAEGWTRGGWARNDRRPVEARRAYSIANRTKQRLSNLNKRIDRMRRDKDMSGPRKEREIIALYHERTTVYKRAVMRMRDPYNHWQREN